MAAERTPWWQRTEVILVSVAASLAAVAEIFDLFPPFCKLLPEGCVTPTTIEGPWIDTTTNTSNKFSPDIIHLFQDGTRVHGEYNESDNGEIVRGNLNNRHLEAIWIEDDSAKDCETEKEGRQNWGRVKINFDEDRQEFDGWWQYCDLNPNKLFQGRRAN